MSRRLGDVRTFAVYYGTGGEDVLSTYDLAIVAAPGRDRERIAAIREKGTLILAYLSVLEAPLGEPDDVRRPGEALVQEAPANVLTGPGGPVVNRQWRTWVLDPRHERTRDRFLGQAEDLLDRGYDGLFLDTMADLEDLPEAVAAGGLTGQATIVEAARLVAEAAASFGCAMVQNRGFRLLLPLTMPYLDGLCWESFPYRRIGLFPRRNRTIRSLQGAEGAAGLRVLALNEWSETKVAQQEERSASRAARRCGFPWYGTLHYTDLPSPAPAAGVMPT